VPATPDIARAELDKSSRFGALLRARVPHDWPPPLNDDESMTWVLRLMEERFHPLGWAMWYFVRAGAAPVVIGNGGFKGPPDPEGVVELGYSVMPEHQRLGFASEAVGALLRWAFSHAEVTRVIAHTLPDLAPSIRVLGKVGFQGPSPGAERGTIRFELKGPDFVAHPKA
jgi:RimJ/RimL family protein N-acetyltransferase